MKAWELLDRGADALDRNGWMQGGGSHGVIEGDSPNCASVAMSVILGHCNYSPAHHALSQAVGGHGFEAIFEWNDTKGRTKDEVTSMMRAVAASLRAAESLRELAPA